MLVAAFLSVLTTIFGAVVLADPSTATAVGVIYLCVIATVSLVHDLRRRP